MREQALAQLDTIRRELIERRVRYLALASGEVDDHRAVCLLGVSVVEFVAPPPEFGPSNILASLLRYRYPEDEALVEEFATDHGPAVGVRRLDVLTVPQTDPAQEIDTGVAEAMVLFADLGVVGLVSGYSLDVEDIALTAALVGAIAHTLNITAPEPLSA